MPSKDKQPDRDLIIRLETLMNQVFKELQEIKEEVRSGLKEKASKSEVESLRLAGVEVHNRHDERIEKLEQKTAALERAYWVSVGALSVIQILIQIAIKRYG